MPTRVVVGAVVALAACGPALPEEHAATVMRSLADCILSNRDTAIKSMSSRPARERLDRICATNRDSLPPEVQELVQRASQAALGEIVHLLMDADAPPDKTVDAMVGAIRAAADGLMGA